MSKMILIDESVVKLALGALENSRPINQNSVLPHNKHVAAITALREALAQQQEPVARQYQGRDGVWRGFINEKHYKNTLEDGSWPIRDLYTSPQPVQQECQCNQGQVCQVCDPILPAKQERVEPDYAWPTVADYEKDVGFEVNQTFKMAWDMARTTNSFLNQLAGVTPQPAQRKPLTDELQILRAVSDEYNDWIRAHASGMGYDDFLKQRLAANGIKEQP